MFLFLGLGYERIEKTNCNYRRIGECMEATVELSRSIPYDMVLGLGYYIPPTRPLPNEVKLDPTHDLFGNNCGCSERSHDFGGILCAPFPSQHLCVF